jgi:hypothetical protein
MTKKNNITSEQLIKEARDAYDRFGIEPSDEDLWNLIKTQYLTDHYSNNPVPSDMSITEVKRVLGITDQEIPILDNN